MTRRMPPFAFFWLHCANWPVGVIVVALGSSLVKAGVPVRQVATIIAAVSLAFTLEVLWAPVVDATLTRRRWYVAGITVMCGCITAVFFAPWNSAGVPLLTALTFVSCSGAAIALVAAKGIMAYEVPAAQLGRASGFYTAGGLFSAAAAGGGTLWLLTHLANRPLVAALTVGIAALAAAAIVWAPPAAPAARRTLTSELRAALADLWRFIRTPTGALIAVLCVIPFGTGTSLLDAIATEWSVSPDQLAAWGPLAATASIGGAVLVAGRLSARLGPWKTYILLGWIIVVVLAALAIAPRTPLSFFALRSVGAAAGGGCYAAALGLVMNAIGKGAASTKAAALWSLFNFSAAYPVFVDGKVHDHMGTVAMLWTHAGMDATGFGILLLVASWLGVSLRSSPASSAALA